MDSSGADISWQNPKSGNTIAIISECSEMKDPALSDLENDAAQAFSAAKVVQTTKETFSDREALRSQIQGTVDGIAVKMDILTFKKNSCNYSVTFMGRLRLFDLDHSAFEQFLKGFSVP
ncbi:MAG: hypothetical protein COT73_06520 [Bdellovibrio sp. CG10_big_fil_rev_8_21_14_0_10_47_8]|nr:MAG: hypothetical protein COT73_06520 [Bdellovibrio sp. CG10_big_fil_rev_8_21_14_0_10_47_8]